MVTNNIEEYKGVYVLAQQVDNEFSGIALELLGKGKEVPNSSITFSWDTGVSK